MKFHSCNEHEGIIWHGTLFACSSTKMCRRCISGKRARRIFTSCDMIFHSFGRTWSYNLIQYFIHVYVHECVQTLQFSENEQGEHLCNVIWYFVYVQKMHLCKWCFSENRAGRVFVWLHIIFHWFVQNWLYSLLIHVYWHGNV